MWLGLWGDGEFMEVDPGKVVSFETPQDFSEWLQQHHDNTQEIWVQLYKKHSDIASINWEQAVIEALAWGWVDGIKKSNDEVSWFQRFTPRKPKSNWSRKNRAHVEKLIADGRMQKPGMLLVEAAKADGRWDAAYAGSADMEIPDYFMAALSENPKAAATFATLKRTSLFFIYHQLHSAKKPETRHRRMNKMIDALARGEALV